MTLNRYVIQENFGFSVPFMELIGLSVLYIILRTLPQKKYVWLLLAAIISGFVQACYGNLQLFEYFPSNHSKFKLTGSFFNPGPYAGFLAAVWPIGLGMYLFNKSIIAEVQKQIKTKSKTIKRLIGIVFEYIPFLTIVYILVVLPSTQSRAAWVAVLISTLLLIECKYHLLHKFITLKSKTRKSILVIGTTLIICVGVFGLYTLKKGSSDGRLFIWKVSLEMIQDYPVFGVGYDRFKAHYMNYQANYFAKHGETTESLVADNTYYAFNEWLQFIVENGLLGLLLLVLFLYILFKINVEKENKNVFFIIIGGILATSAFAFFSYPMQILPIKLILVVLFALLASLDVKKYQILRRHGKPLNFRFFVFVLSVISVTNGLAYTRTLDKSFKTWKDALYIYQYRDYEEAIEVYADAYPDLKKEGDFLMNYGKALSLAKQDKEAAQMLERAKKYLNTTIIETALGDSYKTLKVYDKSEEAYYRAANMIPSRFYPMYLLAKLYDENGDKKKAEAMAKKILEKEVKIPSTAIKEIRMEMKKVLSKSDKDL
ncbi:O-antigen ligase family protein [Flavivirga eckloniae]|nr:O-antigen ligase family protein [Flavivirga eckloniae]